VNKVLLILTAWLATTAGLLTAAETNEAPVAAPAPSATNANPVASLAETLAHLQGRALPSPGPADSSITQIISAILQQSHFMRQPFDDTMSSKFLDQYIDALDPQHLHFTADDLKEFNEFRTALDDLTKHGDTTPGYRMFSRLLQRMEERAEWVLGLLRDETFDFSGDEMFRTDRRKEPFPEGTDEARALWRQHLRYEYLQEVLAKQKPEEIKRTLARRYARRLRLMKEMDRDQVLGIYLTSLGHVYDPHSDYMSKSEYDAFSINMKLSLVGIGAQLESEDGYCKIKDLLPGGPAIKSKQLKASDRIIGVAQGDGEFTDVVDMNLNKVVDLIRGKKGSTVRLQVIPGDAPDPSERKVVTLVRDEIKLEDSQAKGRIIEMPVKNGKSRRLGYIDLPSFYADFKIGANTTAKGRSTSQDVGILVRKFMEQKVNGIILDLRRNGGGSLEEAVRLTGLFIKEGPVVQIRAPNGKVQVSEDEDPGVLYDGPLMVLTSRFSASASEIVAAALQDYGRALVVGDSTTHGKGTVQTLVELDPFMRQFGSSVPQDGAGAIKLTVQKFYRANGGSTQLKGVTPDLPIPSPADYADVGEKALDNPMPWDEVPRAEYDPVNRVAPYLTELKRRSDERLQRDHDFVYLQQDIEETRKAVETKSVSLNASARVTERDENEKRRKERDAERLRRHDAPLRMYEFTLKQAQQPGLPAPMLISSLTNSTNLPSAAHGSTQAGDAEDDEDVKMPPVDFTMKEARRILLDFIELQQGGGMAVKTAKAAATVETVR
jgi:carboxyl-terminal processing protease